MADLDTAGIRLRALRMAYVPRLQQQLRELESLVAELADDPSQLAAVTTLAHKVAGTSGSYGFSNVSDLVGELSRATAKTPHEQLQRLIADARTCDLREPNDRVHRLWLGSTTLLVVDDDDDLLAYMEELASRYGVRLVTASSQLPALAAVIRHKPDAAIIDVNLGSKALDGFDLARQMREADPDLPFAFTSVQSTVANRIKGIELGCTLFVDKPISPDRFVDTIVRLRASGARMPLRVMVLGDIGAKALAILLERQGMDCQLCTGPLEILQRLARFRPHALVIDAVLPWINALDAARVVRSDARYWELPILVMVEDVTPGARRACLKAGVDGFLLREGSELNHLAEIVHLAAVRGAARATLN